jgi:hypothetical protein
MSLLDTFKTYNPVTLTVGCLWVAVGLWAIFMLLPTRTLIGDVFILVLCVVIPISLGAAIIHNQLRLRKNSN